MTKCSQRTQISPQNPFKKSWAWCTRGIPDPGEMETGGSPRLTVRQLSLLIEF